MIPEIFTHSPYLSVQTLGKNNTKTVLSHPLHKTRSCHRPENRNTCSHLLNKIIGKWFVRLYNVFLFMKVSRLHNFIHKVSLICEKKKPFRLFIKPPHRVNPKRIMKILYNRRLFSLLFCTAYNSFRFIKKKQNFPFLFLHRLAVYKNAVPAVCFFSRHGCFSVYCNPSFLYQTVRLASGTDTCIA